MAAGFEDFSHHDALADAEACAAIIVHAAKRHEADDVERLAHVTRVPFGAIGPRRDARRSAPRTGRWRCSSRTEPRLADDRRPGDVGCPCDTVDMDILALVIGLVVGALSARSRSPSCSVAPRRRRRRSPKTPRSSRRATRR